MAAKNITNKELAKKLAKSGTLALRVQNKDGMKRARTIARTVTRDHLKGSNKYVSETIFGNTVLLEVVS